MNNTDSKGLLPDSLSIWTQCLAGRSCRHSGEQDHLEFEMVLRNKRTGCKSLRTSTKYYPQAEKMYAEEKKVLCKVSKDL